MKKSIALAVVAALTLPQMAMAQRWTTPGTAERHEAAQQKSTIEVEGVAKAQDKKNDRYSHVNAAKAGKVNTAKALKGDDGR